ncbi:glutaminyl-peptide cyclotransferase [Microbulbifer rhizosphaerae]|uniref:Glutamine cyclotransferase n=1 Tax=Microbulbifer rhizosphaerae TaxID=1562603 RepID=A0A7W4WC52_9GAMM|nr:glutaminyl-peptide cyclotransferase [Microbulbifer rhizosphaerae]MBB3060861.1 glutamine cyclotransferase [Microbulbifer rhizosphaerae]
MRILKALLLALAPVAALAAAAPLPETPFELLGERSRPADRFTQGLYFDGERWWESSGLYRRSWLAEYTDPGGNPLRRKWLAENRFAEGLAVHGDKLYLLTYRAGELQVYRRKDLAPVNKLGYSGEGWGLASDGEQLIMSDGSDELTFRNPDTFEVERRLKVHGGGEEWTRLNELEYVRGLIWANIWQDSRIIAIDPASGEVRGLVDLRSLAPESRHPDVVANGIAWDEKRNGLWVTGKYWPKLYLIRPQGLGFDAPGTRSSSSASGAELELRVPGISPDKHR